MIGYFTNSTAGTQIVHPRAKQNVLATTTGPHVTAVNMTVAMGAASTYSPNRNTVRAMNTGYMFDVDVPDQSQRCSTLTLLWHNGHGRSITGNALVLLFRILHVMDTQGYISYGKLGCI